MKKGIVIGAILAVFLSVSVPWAAQNLTSLFQFNRAFWAELSHGGNSTQDSTADFGAFSNGTAVIYWMDAYNSTNNDFPFRTYFAINATFDGFTFANDLSAFNGNSTVTATWEPNSGRIR